MERPWDSLPRPLLTAIFSKLDLEDRFSAAFLVCRGWADAGTSEPRCWQSMLPEGMSPEEAFIKSYSTRNPFRRPIDSFAGISRLRTLLRLADGGITTLYVAPFLTNEPYNDDEVLRCIAWSCPHLKYLSLQGSFGGSEAAILEVIRNCPELEILDFAYSTCFSDGVLEELGSCCRHLRAIRKSGDISYNEAYAIGWNLDRVKLMNLAFSCLCSRGLSAILRYCADLKYLDISGCSFIDFEDIMRDPPWEPLGSYISKRGIICPSLQTDI